MRLASTGQVSESEVKLCGARIQITGEDCGTTWMMLVSPKRFHGLVLQVEERIQSRKSDSGTDCHFQGTEVGQCWQEQEINS